MEAQIFSSKLPDITEVIELCDSDLPIMDEIYQVLKKHDALKRFGVTLLHEHFDVADDEVLIELTNRESRTQTIKPVKKDHPFLTDAIETSWRLDTGMPVMSCKCVKFGGNHEHHERG